MKESKIRIGFIQSALNILNIKVNEKFILKSTNLLLYPLNPNFDLYSIDGSGKILMHSKFQNTWINSTIQLVDLFNGNYKVIKNRFKPELNQLYYTYDFDSNVNYLKPIVRKWKNTMIDLSLYKLKFVFETEEECFNKIPWVYQILTNKPANKILQENIKEKIQKKAKEIVYG